MSLTEQNQVLQILQKLIVSKSSASKITQKHDKINDLDEKDASTREGYWFAFMLH